MAFAKAPLGGRPAAEWRKAWIEGYRAGDHVDHAVASRALTYSDFVTKELVLYSRANLRRSIPSLMDGLKPSQRKILWSCFRLKWTAKRPELKVAELAGLISAEAAYHHGQESLVQAIVKMAHDFVGSNNVPLLAPVGMFGTRLRGGADAAQARYISTRPQPIARALFPRADDAVLPPTDDDEDEQAEVRNDVSYQDLVS